MRKIFSGSYFWSVRLILMKLIYLKWALKCDSFSVTIGIKIPSFRVSITITLNRIYSEIRWTASSCRTSRCWIDKVTQLVGVMGCGLPLEAGRSLLQFVTTVWKQHSVPLVTLQKSFIPTSFNSPIAISSESTVGYSKSKVKISIAISSWTYTKKL